MPRQIVRCKDCVFAGSQKELAEDEFLCQRYPPNSSDYPRYHFPYVKGTCWCGEGELRTKEEGPDRSVGTWTPE